MAKIEITKTELMWPGKYNEDGTRRPGGREQCGTQALVKAQGDHHDVARKFADALDSTKFRDSVSPQKLSTMVARGERLGQRAAAARLKVVAADRLRMLQDSQAWKSILSNWRLVQAAMPDRPELEAPFAFMQAYMALTRSTAPPQTPAAQ
jgi:hypothetical protein